MSGFQRALSRAHPALFCLFAGLAGFSTYFAMYAFRKPFTAASFEHVSGWAFLLDYKIALVLAQVAGYALSKLIGIKVIAEVSPSRRIGLILGLVGTSWLALVAFALIPAPWNVITLFFNGLPLGMIWGLVFGYMEGRRVSEVLGSILCASFILASGAVKSVGSLLMDDYGIDRFWMPAATGAVFLPLLLVGVLGLSLLPPPSEDDEAARVRRAPMGRAERQAFLALYAPGIAFLVAGYVLLTAFRDFRDNFAAEIWAGLGFDHPAALFTASELPVAVIALAALGAIILVKDNRRALMVIHGLVGLGFALIGIGTLAFQSGAISPLTWMIMTGAGVYVAYTPFNAMLFDRLVAYSGRIATAGFLIYIADASGYVGSVALLLWKNFGVVDMNWVRFFTLSAYATSLVGMASVAAAGIYFARRKA